MKKLLLLLLLSIGLKAQTISGIVRDEKNEILAGATVLLMSDSSLVKGKFTDSLGKFQFDGLSTNQQYFLKITMIGFVPMQSDTVKPSCFFSNLFLKDAADITLEEVVVKAEKPMIENEIDRTIVNVDAMPGGNTGNVYSLLEKTPGVNVRDNNISLNGKSGVNVFINGRPTNLGSRDLENYLKSLSASDIDKIELMENPPAKYDAAGGAIINLKLRQSRKAGWAGSVNFSHNVGKYWRNYDGLSLNMNHGKLNAYASGGYFNERYEDLEFRNTHFLKEDYHVKTDSRGFTQSRGFSYHGGLDYFLDKKTTLGVFYRNSSPFVPSEGTVLNTVKNVTETIINPSSEYKTYDGASAYLTRKLNDKGRELSLEINQVRYMNDATLRFNRAQPFEYVLATKIRTRSANLDYIHPIKGGNLEVGVKTSFMHNDNDNRYFNIRDDKQVADLSKTNHFLYDENINAVYASGSKRFKRWDIKAGIRMETTHAEGNQLGNEVVPRSGFERSYTNVFHNLFVSYKLDSAGQNTLTFVTQRRLSRPYYLYLNPFLMFKDPYNYSTGNPELNPQMQNRYEINYRHKGIWNIGVHVNPFTDVILPTTETRDNIFYTKQDNIAEGYMYMLNVGLNTQFFKWWRVNYTARLAHIGLRGKLYVENLDYSINVLRGELNNNFRISDKLSISNYVNYATKDYNGQTVTKGRLMVNLGLQYKFLKDKASLNASFDDIFFSWRNRNFSTNITNAYITSLSYSDSRRVGVSLSYRFGNNKEMKKGKSSNANDDRM